MRLPDRVALITGGGTGIGRATAEIFAKEGAKIAVSGRRKKEIENTVQTIQKLGGDAIAIAGDVSKVADAERMVQSTVETYGKIDILVNNAGVIVRNASVTNVSIEDWDLVLNINLRGTFLVSRFALQEMMKRQSGNIINISSTSGLYGDFNFAPYNASKGGLNLLTKNMALDYARYGIRVNCICPSLVATPMPRGRLKPGEDFEKAQQEWGKNFPIGRIGRPEDVAYAALYLASDESSWVTGIELVLDGGITASHPPSSGTWPRQPS